MYVYKYITMGVILRWQGGICPLKYLTEWAIVLKYIIQNLTFIIKVEIRCEVPNNHTLPI